MNYAITVACNERGVCHKGDQKIYYITKCTVIFCFNV